MTGLLGDLAAWAQSADSTDWAETGLAGEGGLTGVGTEIGEAGDTVLGMTGFSAVGAAVRGAAGVCAVGAEIVGSSDGSSVASSVGSGVFEAGSDVEGASETIGTLTSGVSADARPVPATMPMAPSEPTAIHSFLDIMILPCLHSVNQPRMRG